MTSDGYLEREVTLRWGFQLSLLLIRRIYDEILQYKPQILITLYMINNKAQNCWDPWLSDGLTFPNKFQYIQLLYRRYRRLRVELKRALSIAFILMLDALPIAPKILVRIVNASPWASAFFWNWLKLSPGLIANTIPSPQWLGGPGCLLGKH